MAENICQRSRRNFSNTSEKRIYSCSVRQALWNFSLDESSFSTPEPLKKYNFTENSKVSDWKRDWLVIRPLWLKKTVVVKLLLQIYIVFYASNTKYISCFILDIHHLNILILNSNIFFWNFSMTSTGPSLKHRWPQMGVMDRHGRRWPLGLSWRSKNCYGVSVREWFLKSFLVQKFGIFLIGAFYSVQLLL